VVPASGSPKSVESVVASNLLRLALIFSLPTRRYLGHADARSTDAYVVLASSDVKGLVRDR